MDNTQYDEKYLEVMRDYPKNGSHLKISKPDPISVFKDQHLYVFGETTIQVSNFEDTPLDDTHPFKRVDVSIDDPLLIPIDSYYINGKKIPITNKEDKS